jgi:colanic acid biosynthesis glycosyl transferase WcaI
MFAASSGKNIEVIRPLRILYLAQFFEPEPMLKGASFVRGLIEAGHEVEVVTGFPNYPLGRLYDGYRVSLHKREVVEGVSVHRVPLYPSHGKSSLGRILNYFSFVASASVYGVFFARKFDVIYSYPPPTVGLAAAAIGAIRRRPFVLDIQDLWPESVLKSGMAGTGRMAGILTAVCNFVYRRSTRIIAQSRGIAAKLVERGVPAGKIDTIFNWADEDAARAQGTCDLSSYGFEGGFNIVYGGNLGVLQGLDTMIRAAHLAAVQVPELRLLLIGDGADRGRLEALRDALGATNVRIAPGVPRSQIGDVFAAADVLALHLVEDPLFEITIPQKTQFYMAMGKPVLCGVKGEAGAFLLESKAGLSVKSGNTEGMAEAMVQFALMSQSERDAMGARGRAAYADHFSFTTAIEATDQTLSAAILEKH